MRQSKFHRHRLVAVLLPLALVWFAPSLAAQPTIDVEVTGDASPGGTATATVTVDTTETVMSYAWTYEDGVEPTIVGGADTNALTFTLGPPADYKAHLFDFLAEPPVDEDDLPPNVPFPEGEFPAALQNRWEVVGLNHFTLEETGLVEFELEIMTNVDTYVFDVEIHTALPWEVTTGVRNVPVGLPVLLQGKEQATYDWALASPGGSAATLQDATTRNPEFIPDVAGLYTLTVTEDEGEGATAEEKAVVTLDIYAGTWRGVIVDEDAEGRPVADAACTGCHNSAGIPAPDVFTPWKGTGHAEIFTQNINSSPYWGPQCFECHTVGYNTEVANGGIDEAGDYQDFLDAGILGNPDSGNWSRVLEEFPMTAQLANIQCENCHGPQTSDAHFAGGGVRYNLSANICASCHGEPPRHARYQQWQLSAHANYELAIDEGDNGNCARCHTGNGFLTWLPVLLGDEEGDPLDDIFDDDPPWNHPDETHPQTCVTCHDPHMIGTTSGANSNANVYISGDTPPLIAGFQAIGVGRGAICMTCHNSRRGARNDNLFGGIYGTAEAARAPHGSAQADVLMGQNAYLVPVGNRGNHSLVSNVEDTCVTCHMEATPPPDILSYNQGGSNHTFYARPDICGECHGFEDASIIQTPVMNQLADLEGKLEMGLLDLINDQIKDDNSVDLGGDALLTGTGDIKEIQIAESRGRQAIIVTLADDTVVGPVRMNDVEVVPPVGDPFDIFDVANPNLIKAGWNYWLAHNDGSYGVHNPTFIGGLLTESIAALEAEAPECINDGNTICLNQDRFQVEVTWRDFDNNVGSGVVVPFRSDDSGLFYFFSQNNWEMLIKVLTGCSINDRYWVFFAATTDVEFEVTVTDTQEDVTKTYTNPLGNPANAVTDTAAFDTCP